MAVKFLLLYYFTIKVPGILSRKNYSLLRIAEVFMDFFVALYHHLFVGSFDIQCPVNRNICSTHVGDRTAMIVVAKCIHYHDVTEDGELQILGHTNQH